MTDHQSSSSKVFALSNIYPLSRKTTNLKGTYKRRLGTITDGEMATLVSLSFEIQQDISEGHKTHISHTENNREFKN